jgi:hypothetical protein
MHLIGFLLLRHCSFASLRHWRHGQSLADNRLCFLQDVAEMILSPETLRINLVDIFGA